MAANPPNETPKLAIYEPFSAQELDDAKKLRERLGPSHGIPGDLCTDFGLARLLRASRGDFVEAEQRLRELADHMHAFGMQTLKQNPVKGVGQPILQRVFERFAISRLDPPHGDVFSDNLLIFVQRLDGVDIKQILRIVPLGHILEAYAQLQLNWMRAILEQENKTDRPAAAVAVIDLHGLPLRDFVNPLSPSARMARLIVRIWSEYFTENLVRIFLVHPPGLLSLFWQVARHIMDQKTWSKLVVVTKGSELLEHLTPHSVPQAYGGARRDETGFSACPTTCVSAPKVIHPEELFPGPEAWWASQVQDEKPMPKWVHVSLAKPKGKSQAVHESEPIECQAGERLLWMFTSTGDLQFELVCRPSNKGGKEFPLWPRTVVCSLNVPEHGIVECEVSGHYFARFGGLASANWLMGLAPNTKVQYWVHREPAITQNGNAMKN